MEYSTKWSGKQQNIELFQDPPEQTLVRKFPYVRVNW